MPNQKPSRQAYASLALSLVFGLIVSLIGYVFAQEVHDNKVTDDRSIGTQRRVDVLENEVANMNETLKRIESRQEKESDKTDKILEEVRKQ